MMKRVIKLTALIVIPMAAASMFLIKPDVKIPLGIVAGALLALFNFRGMVRNLENLIGTERPTAKLVILGIFRMMMVFAVIVALAVAKAVDLLGLMVGFTVVVVLVVREGYIVSQTQ